MANQDGPALPPTTAIDVREPTASRSGQSTAKKALAIYARANAVYPTWSIRF